MDGDGRLNSQSRLDSAPESGERVTNRPIALVCPADEEVRHSWLLGNPNHSTYYYRKTGVGEHAGEVSSSDSESSTVEVLPEFKALGLTGTPPKFQISPCWSNYCADDTSSSESDPEIVEESKPKEVSDFDIEEERRELEKYFQENTCSTFRETCIMLRDVERARLAAKKNKMPAAQRADMIARAPYFLEEQLKLQAREQASREEAAMQILLRRQPRRGISVEELRQNANSWMRKEVMVAFDEYKTRSATLTGHECQLAELKQQCFNVENYSVVFHHFNFTVKIQNPISSDSRVSTFFAELKEIFGRKYYFCSPLEDSENGECYACTKQGVDDLKHPATGGYFRGSTGSTFPFMYLEDDSDSD